VAFPRFILEGAEKKYNGRQKKIQVGQNHARRARNFVLPPPYKKFCLFDRIRFCPWGRTGKRGWGGRKRKREKHLIIEDRGRETN
jgi:hypothetical protein